MCDRPGGIEAAVELCSGPGMLSGRLCAVAPKCCPSWLQVTQDAYGPGIDVLISNAAVNPAAGPILQMQDGAIDKILEINVKSAVMLTREVAPHMSKVSAAFKLPSQPPLKYLPRAESHCITST